MEKGKLVGKGVAFRLLQFLMDKYNFTYDIVKHDRNIIGSQDDFTGSLMQSLYTNVRTCDYIIVKFYRSSPKCNIVFRLYNLLGIWVGCRFSAGSFRYAWFHQVLVYHIVWRWMVDANETSNNIGHWYWTIGTVYTECMDFDFDFAACCRPIDLRHHLYTVQIDRWPWAASVWFAALHVVCLRCIAETRQHPIANCRYLYRFSFIISFFYL